MRLLIVDDEAPARTKLKRLLAAEPDVEIVGEAANGAKAIAAVRELKPDAVFLDVQMPIVDGFGVIDEIGVASMPYVVFVTAYDAHALRAFDVQALDYLLKPYSPDRLQTVMSRLRRELARERATDDFERRLNQLFSSLGRGRHLERLMVERDGRARLLPVEQIDWIEADRNDARLHARESVHVVRSTLNALAERLDPSKFLRISRSTIVRLDAVRELQPWFHGDYRIVLEDGTELTWSRRYRARARGAFEIGRDRK
jgi:two-component system, LytTR family, response regulator